MTWGQGFCTICGQPFSGVHTCYGPPYQPWQQELQKRELERIRRDAEEWVWKIPTAVRNDGRTGRVNIEWLMAAFLRCKESEAFIRLEIEDKGVAVVGQSGESYFAHLISWQAMESADVNPLIPAIEHVERKLEEAE